MEPFRLHLFACQQVKPEGLSSCTARGATEVLDAMRQELAAQGLDADVQVTTCGSLGLCERGPNMVVYPEGIWYSGVKVEDVPELVREHFVGGRPVERLVNRDAGAVRQEIEANKAKMIAAMKARAAAGEGSPTK